MSRTRAFKIGFYFDLYSADRSDWEREATYNKGLGTECTDVLLEYPPGCSNFPPEDITYLRGLLDGVRVAAHAPTLNLSLVALNRGIVLATIAETLASMRVGHQLGAKTLTIHGGEYPYYAALNGRSPDDEFVRNVAEVLAEGQRLEMEVCLENLKSKNIYPQTTDELDRALGSDRRLQFALDIRHFCVNRIDPRAAFLRFRERVRSIHYRVDNGLDDSGLARFLETLLEHEYEGDFLIEDAALNVADKSEKPMIEAGAQKVSALLRELGAAPGWPK